MKKGPPLLRPLSWLVYKVRGALWERRAKRQLRGRRGFIQATIVPMPPERIGEDFMDLVRIREAEARGEPWVRIRKTSEERNGR